ncbi:hypothetical protein Dimus_023194 [Dionaea muscipula]
MIAVREDHPAAAHAASAVAGRDPPPPRTRRSLGYARRREQRSLAEETKPPARAIGRRRPLAARKDAPTVFGRSRLAAPSPPPVARRSGRSLRKRSRHALHRSPREASVFAMPPLRRGRGADSPPLHEGLHRDRVLVARQPRAPLPAARVLVARRRSSGSSLVSIEFPSVAQPPVLAVARLHFVSKHQPTFLYARQPRTGLRCQPRAPLLATPVLRRARHPRARPLRWWELRLVARRIEFPSVAQLRCPLLARLHFVSKRQLVPLCVATMHGFHAKRESRSPPPELTVANPSSSLANGDHNFHVARARERGARRCLAASDDRPSPSPGRGFAVAAHPPPPEAAAASAMPWRREQRSLAEETSRPHEPPAAAAAAVARKDGRPFSDARASAAVAALGRFAAVVASQRKVESPRTSSLAAEASVLAYAGRSAEEAGADHRRPRRTPPQPRAPSSPTPCSATRRPRALTARWRSSGSSLVAQSFTGRAASGVRRRPLTSLASTRHVPLRVAAMHGFHAKSFMAMHGLRGHASTCP